MAEHNAKGPNYNAVIRLYGQHPGWSLQRIGDRVGISRERVRQLLLYDGIKKVRSHSVPTPAKLKQGVSSKFYKLPLYAIKVVLQMAEEHPDWSYSRLGRQIGWHADYAKYALESYQRMTSEEKDLLSSMSFEREGR